MGPASAVAVSEFGVARVHPLQNGLLTDSDTAMDDIIAAVLRHNDDDARLALAAAGVAGLNRVLDLLWGQAKLMPSEPLPPGGGRWRAEQWTQCLAIVAKSCPEEFIRALDGRTLHTAEVAVLGGTGSRAAIRLLCAHVHDADWLVRRNSVHALIRLGFTEGRQCVETALIDPNLAVRFEAIKGVSRWDPQRAIVLFEDLLRERNLTPLLCQWAKWSIEELRAGRVLRDPWDPI